MVDTPRFQWTTTTRWSIVAAVSAITVLAADLARLGAQTPPRSPRDEDATYASESWPDVVLDERGFTGTLSCASGSCHGQRREVVGARGSPRLSPRQEYIVWLEHDPHAQSARTLASAAFQRILAVVSGGAEDSAIDPNVYVRCAACHDPQGLSHFGDRRLPRPGNGSDIATRGIGCESCHGSARNWLTAHYERGVDRTDLQSLGQIDGRHLLTRGRVCAACHVGDDRHDMNHDMIAAGHPPLRFELSAYHDLLRVKHWSDVERLSAPEFKSRLWAAGQWAAADATLGLLIARAERAQATEASQTGASVIRQQPRIEARAWPEFSEYDCLACHQRLRIAGKPRAGVGESALARTKSGDGPAWQPWYFSEHVELLRAGDALGCLSQRSTDLRELMLLSRRSSPGDVASAARATRVALRRATPPVLGRTVGEPGAGESVILAPVGPFLLDRIARRDASVNSTWSHACLDYLLVRSVYQQWRDTHQQTRGAGSPEWCDGFERRLGEVAESLRFGSTEFEWPAYDWDGLPGARPQVPLHDLAAIRHRLKLLAVELRRQFSPNAASAAAGGSS